MNPYYIDHLINYFNDIKSNQIKKWYSHDIKTKYELNKYLTALFEKHNEYELYCKHGICPQLGGDSDVFDKLKKVQVLFDTFTNINVAGLKQSTDEVNTKIDEIIQKLNGIKISNTSSIQNVYNRDAITNSLDHMMVEIKNFGNNMSVNADRKNTNFIINPPASFEADVNAKNISQYAFSLRTIRDNFDVTIKATDKTTATYEARLKHFLSELKKLNTDIGTINSDQLLDQYTKLDTFFQIQNKEYSTQLELNPGQSDVHKVEPFELVYNKFIADVQNTNILTDDEYKLLVDNFKNNLIQLNTDITNGTKKQRDIVDYYNYNILRILKHKGRPQGFIQSSTPEYYFDGIYTTRVKNNILNSPSQLNTSFDVITKLANVSELVETKYNDMRLIYKPTFDKSNPVEYVELNPNAQATVGKSSPIPPKVSPKVSPKISPTTQGTRSPPPISNVQTQAGGNLEQTVQNEIVVLGTKLDKLFDKVQSYEKQVELYNINQMKLLFHTLYLMLISTNQLTVNNYIIYSYINKGILQFLYRIIDDIDTRMEADSGAYEIVYIKKYHYVTIKLLKNFTYNIIIALGTDDVVDINASSESVRNGFHLLNHFKSILETYNRMFQNKITIYGRVNDWGKDTLEKDPNDKLFVSDYDINATNKNLGRLTVQKSTCASYVNSTHNTKPEEILFTEIFDTKMYPNNGIISNYMAIQTMIADGVGIALMTYGYSGVGKTFTLFGSSNIGGRSVEGLLQSTLNSISGLMCVKFRLFELYGKGVSYPHYWQQGLEHIDQIIYSYQAHMADGSLKLKMNDKGDPTAHIESKDMMNYTQSEQDYISIGGDQVKDIFKNFDTFIESVDEHRVKIGTVRETPNNPVSSRSMLVYDFKLTVESDTGASKTIPFIIIDLPGREEIVQTYVETFISKPIPSGLFKSYSKKDQLVKKLALSAMALNPLALPIFYLSGKNTTEQIPNIIIQEYNKLSDIDRSEVANTRIEDNFRKNFINKLVKITGEKKRKLSEHDIEVELENESISTQTKDDMEIIFTLKQYFTFDEKTKAIVLVNNTIEPNHNYTAYLDPSIVAFQYEALISVHIINRLILLRKFDILKNMFEKIADTIINKDIIDAINNEKNDKVLEYFIKQYDPNMDQQVLRGLTLDEKRDKCIELSTYDYLITPYEGIYINENIIGMIQYLSTKLTSSGSNFVEEQDMNLGFQVQQQKIRKLLKLSKDEKRNKDGTIKHEKVHSLYQKNGNDLMYNTEKLVNSDNDILKEEYDIIKYTYKSDKIFNKQEPIITKVLDAYISQIDDYKVFYLFSNTKMEVKCDHQIKLLDNTKSFISTIVKANK